MHAHTVSESTMCVLSLELQSLHPKMSLNLERNSWRTESGVSYACRALLRPISIRRLQSTQTVLTAEKKVSGTTEGDRHCNSDFLVFCVSWTPAG